MMMESKPKNLGRAYLIDKLRERGLSRRDSARIVRFVFDEMTKALKRGESVEFPLGTLRRVHHQRPKKRGWFLNNIRTIYKRPYTIKHELDKEGNILLNDRK
jgi:nucleoid DNA-binding protein